MVIMFLVLAVLGGWVLMAEWSLMQARRRERAASELLRRLLLGEIEVVRVSGLWDAEATPVPEAFRDAFKGSE